MCWEAIFNINKRDLVFINQLTEYKLYEYRTMSGRQFKRLCLLHEKYIYRMKLRTSFVKRTRLENIILKREEIVSGKKYSKEKTKEEKRIEEKFKEKENKKTKNKSKKKKVVKKKPVKKKSVKKR